MTCAKMHPGARGNLAELGFFVIHNFFHLSNRTEPLSFERLDIVGMGAIQMDRDTLTRLMVTGE